MARTGSSETEARWVIGRRALQAMTLADVPRRFLWAYEVDASSSAVLLGVAQHFLALALESDATPLAPDPSCRESPGARGGRKLTDLEWFSQHPELAERFRGSFVAIANHTVVGSGSARAAYQQAKAAGAVRPLLLDLRHARDPDTFYLGL